MNILGIIFALAAGVFFGIIGPVTKTAYNLGAGVGLAIFLRYIVALLIVSPLIPRQQNLISTYNVLNPILNNMRNNNEGNIIFISSVTGKTGAIGASSYSSTKSALYGLTRSLALENANKNISINTISPGYINEGMGNELTEKHTKNIMKTIPLGKFGETSDILNLTDFLIEKNNYITGNNIDLNGGLI